MGATPQSEPPLLQRLYDRIWLLALSALLFWVVAYIVWGLLDVFSVPAG